MINATDVAGRTTHMSQPGESARSGRIRRTMMQGYALIAPAYAVFLIFLIVPIGVAVVYSFMRLSATGAGSWVGFENYERVFSDPATLRSLLVTASFSIGFVVLGLAITVAVVGFLSSLPRRVKSFFRVTLYLPTIIPIVATALFWKWIFNYSFGMLNALLGTFGIPPVDWLGDPNLAMPSITGMLLATTLGAGILILQAAVDAVPSHLIEAARLDGAGSMRIFGVVTLPLVKPALLYLVVVNTVGALQMFAPFALMTGGGPDGATTTVGYQIYKSAFERFDFGQASALSVLLTILICAVGVIQFRFLSSDVEY